MKCLGDLRDFNSQMSKDGHWLGASRYGYGYPMDGLGYRYPMRGRGAMHGDRAATDNGYMSARLVTRCERSSRRPTFSPGMARNSHARMCLPSRVLSTKPMWPIFKTAKRQQTYLTGGSRSPWRSPSPATARLSRPRDRSAVRQDAYLVIGRGGVFGIDEKYLPIPWQDFKATPQVNLLVLDTTKAIMNSAPQVDNHQFGSAGGFAQQSQKVAAYWNAHLTKSGDVGANGSRD